MNSPTPKIIPVTTTVIESLKLCAPIKSVKISKG